MIVLFVVAQSDEIVRIEGRMNNEEVGHGFFRTSISPGKMLHGVDFNEWRTLSSMWIADDGTIEKHLHGPEPDKNAERPAFLRDVPQP